MPFFKYLFYFLVFIGTPYFAFAQSTENIDYAKDVFDAVNEYRQDSGRALLEWSDAISEIARQHSENMARGMVKFGHAGFSKRSKHIKQFFPEKTTTAENVLFNVVDADDAAANWMASAGHKKNMLGNFTHTGVGVAADKKGHYYFTQIFIR